MKDNFVFYASFLESVEALPEELGNKLLRAIARFGIYGEIDKEDAVIYAILLSIMPNIIKAKERYAASKANGEKGGRPRKIDREKVYELLNEGMSVAEIAEELSCSKSSIYDIRKTFTETQKPETNLDIDIDIDIEKEIEKEKEEEIEIEKENNHPMIDDRYSENRFWNETGKDMRRLIKNQKELNRVVGELAPRFGWGWLNYAMAGRAEAFNKHGFGLLYMPKFQQEATEGFEEYEKDMADYSYIRYTEER